MSERSYGSRAYPFLHGVLFKRGWGESLDCFDPMNLGDALRDVLGEALSAIDDPNEAVDILFKLRDDQGSASPEAVSMLLRAAMWAGWTSTLRNACAQAVEHGGVAPVELLVETFADEMDEPEVARLLCGTCKLAVTAIPDYTQRLEVLRTAYKRARDVASELVIVEPSPESCEASAPSDRPATEILLDHYFEAALADPWPFLQEMFASLQEAAERPTVSEQAGLETLIQVLQETVSAEGVALIWEYYESQLEWGEFDHLHGLWETYGNAVRAITDPKWVTHHVLEGCDEIASAHDDHSCWVPDRVQLSQACMDTITALGGPAAARNAISKAFELAVHNSTEPWSAMARVFRDVGNRVGEDASAHIAHIVMRATQGAVRKLYSTARLSAQEVTADPERTIDLLLKAADGERAFGAFQQAQNANEGTRERAIERLIEALSEPESAGDPVPFDDELSDVPLLRAFRLAATALGDPTAAAHLLAVTHMATQRVGYDIDVEYGLRALADTVAVMNDPAAEAALLYDAYVDAILDGNDPDAIVLELLEVTKRAIADSGYAAVGVKALIDGVSVQPPGWPPPMPAWLMISE